MLTKHILKYIAQGLSLYPEVTGKIIACVLEMLLIKKVHIHHWSIPLRFRDIHKSKNVLSLTLFVCEIAFYMQERNKRLMAVTLICMFVCILFELTFVGWQVTVH